MTPSPEEVSFDPEKVRFDLPLSDAFGLTKVLSLNDFRRLVGSLPEIRGISYFFVNRLDGSPRLLVTVMTCEDEEITALYEVDIEPLGIARDDLAPGCRVDGNYPVPPRVETKIRRAIRDCERWRLRGIKQ